MTADNPLQTENCALRQRLEDLLYEARQNEEKMRRFDQLERRLIGASSLADLVRLLLTDYKLAFAIEFVTLSLVDKEYEVTRILEDPSGDVANLDGLTLLRSSAPLENLYKEASGPCLEAFDADRHQALFNAPIGAIASVAILPLVRQGELIGSFNFGSANPDRYVAGFGTDFLDRLASVITICLKTALTQERLKQLGLTDGLTGIQNRRYFEHRCRAEVSQALRYQRPLACMFLDIDKFKRINDTHGHQIGDDVLRTIAHVIQSQLRAGDTIARYGGEEFVVLLPQTTGGHAHEIAERIRCSVAATHIKTISGKEITVTISIGLSVLSGEKPPVDCQTADNLVAAADKALYQAKHSGRNRVVGDEATSPGTTRHASWVRARQARLLSRLQKIRGAVISALKKQKCP